MKSFISSKGIGFWFAVASELFALMGLISYSIAGQDAFGFMPAIVVFLVLGIAVGIIFGWRNFLRIGPMVMMIFFGGAASVFVYSRFMYFSHLFYGIASDPITGAMVVSTVAFIGMLVACALSGFFKWEKEEEKR